MTIGIPKEIKNNESRVAITPAGVSELLQLGHTVLVEVSAGKASGYEDSEYAKAGATLLADHTEIFAKADMIIKVKEPLESEYPLIRKNQIVFTYFHFASSAPLTQAMIASGAICIAYETVEKADRSLPLLIPMSEIAGRLSIQEGAKYLEKPMGGKGILLGGVPGVSPAKVLVLGGGIVGTQAAKMAAGLGAQVTIMDVSLPRLRTLADTLPPNVQTIYSSSYAINEALTTADLIIGAVLIPGAKAPKLIRKDMLSRMQKGSVIVDVAVDQGGCIETCRPTTHEEPTFVIDDVVHYCVANMPGAVPYTSTPALTNATLPYILELANKGWKKACDENQDLKKGLNIVEGEIV
ncbi:MAG: alanine dehydrogenase, partial [Leadbetterella sp.]